MYIVIIIIINFDEDLNRSFLELRLDLKSSELELELKSPELELELNCEVELELELKIMELEYNWKNGNDPTLASGNQEKVQSRLVTLWLFIISCYKTTPGLLCSWKPAWSLKKHPHSMHLKPFVKMCISLIKPKLFPNKPYFRFTNQGPPCPQ